MFFNFGFSEPLTVTIEQYIGNTLVQSQQLSAPPEILQAQFLQLVQHVASQSQPMKIRMVRWEDVWNKFDGEWKKIEYYVEFKNWKDDD
mgnify:FL=1